MKFQTRAAAQPVDVTPLEAHLGGEGASAMTPSDLRASLDHLGLTQAELAQLLDTNPRTVRRWESGATPIPGAVAQTLHAWARLQRAGLAWRPEDAILDAGDTESLAAHRFHAMDLDALLERVRARGGPAAPWDVDLDRQRATLGGLQLTFYLLANGGFAPQSYRRRDGVPPDRARDTPLLEDGYACIARALERQGRAARPALRLGSAGIVERTLLVMWEQRPSPTVVVIIPVDVARAVLGQSATPRELAEFCNRNQDRLAVLAQTLVNEGAGHINALGARELRLDKATLERAHPRRFLLGENGLFAGEGA